MKTYTLYGYLLSKAIANGFLVPVYRDKDRNNYFHKLSPDLKTIVAFTAFNIEDFRKDLFVSDIQPVSNIRENHESFFVLKLVNNITIGTYQQTVDTIASLAVANCLNSDIILDTAKKYFKKDFDAAVRNNTLAFRTLGQYKLQAAAFLKNGSSVVQILSIALGRNKQFEARQRNEFINRRITAVIPQCIKMTVRNDIVTAIGPKGTANSRFLGLHYFNIDTTHQKNYITIKDEIKVLTEANQEISEIKTEKQLQPLFVSVIVFLVKSVTDQEEVQILSSPKRQTALPKKLAKSSA